MRVDEELKTYLQVLWRYKWLAVGCALVASAVALGISSRLTPLYPATATLRVASDPGGAAGYIDISLITRLSNTLVEIATSDTSLNEVTKRLGLPKKPSVQVAVVPETELIEINASDADPARARDIANTLASIMVEQSMQLYDSGAPTARHILEGQLTQAKSDLDEALSAYNFALRNPATPAVPDARETPIPDPQLAALEHVVGVRQQMYIDMLGKYEAARVNEQLRANAISIVEPAGLAQQPSSPKVPLNAALGLVAGLVTGVILAFLLDGMDDTLRDMEDIQAITALPIICQVPTKKRRSASVVGRSSSGDGAAMQRAAFDQLRARLLLSQAMWHCTSFLMTSPEPGAGKSTVAANLAISLAESGQRVVLVDMDFHRPRLHSIFNLPNGQGLSDYMCGKIPLEAALLDAPYPNLRVATAGSSLDRVSEWLAPIKIRELLERLDKDGDCVLIDAPSLLAVADPAVLASQADAVILVVAQRGTGRKQLRFTLQQLTELEARVAGIVVTNVPDSGWHGYYAKLPLKAPPIPAEIVQGPKAVVAASEHANSRL